MSLTPGTRLGPYEIVGAIGAGGMGEVYKARDTRLGRTVALKVLPEEFAEQPERRARFEREARAIAALSHPNICVVHDVGQETVPGTAEPLHYLVMEYIEGDTLAARLERDRRSLPLSQTLEIAAGLAEALDAAHRAGIVHRDVKPANIILVKTGAKLLDFGVAKWRGGPAPAASTADTAHGTLIGTVHYMAPEQVEGRDADARSDIWAFGVVLYEMITGQRPFDGESTASVIGAILKDTPAPMSVRQPIVPIALDRIVTRCLQKDAGARWQSAADLRAALDLVAVPGTGGTLGPASGPVVPPARTARVPRLAAALASAAVLLGVGALIGQRLPMAPAQLPSLVQFEVRPPADAILSPAPVAGTPQLALSPDGRHLAFVAMRRRGASQIYIRSLSGLDARPLATTDGASFPFWSADGQSVGFFAGGKLKKIAVDGGASQVVADAPAGRGASWGADGNILFAATPNGQLSRVSSAGGPTSVVTEKVQVQASGQDDARIIGHNWPQVLPNGRFIFYQRAGSPDHQGIYVGGPAGPASVRVMASDGLAHYSDGHLVFVRDGMLMVQPVDGPVLQPAGDAIRVADRVAYFRGSFGYSAIAAAPHGVLAYGPPISTLKRLRWFDRRGVSVNDLGDVGPYVSPRLSADGRTVVVAIAGDTMAERDVWILDIARNTASRVTSDPNADWFPAWAPNGSLYFGSTRTGLTSIFHKIGVQPETMIDTKSAFVATYPQDVSSDGRFITYLQSTTTGYDLGVATLGPSPSSAPFLATGFNEVQGRFAPNQRWIAYASDETGQFEVYVRPYPSADAQWQISSGGGMQPEWKRDGRELFYISRDGKMMVVPVTTEGQAFGAGAPQALFDVETPEAVAPFPTHYAVTADGRRFLVNTVIDQPAQPAITVMVNWTRALKPQPE